MEGDILGKDSFDTVDGTTKGAHGGCDIETEDETEEFSYGRHGWGA